MTNEDLYHILSTRVGEPAHIEKRPDGSVALVTRHGALMSADPPKTEHVYAVVFHDTCRRGYDNVAKVAGEQLERVGLTPLFQTNTMVTTRAQVESPDFSVYVDGGDGPLQILPADVE